MNIEKIKNKVLSEFYPIPNVIDIWLDEQEELYQALIKFEEDDDEAYLCTYTEEAECTNEIVINKKISNKIKKILGEDV